MLNARSCFVFLSLLLLSCQRFPYGKAIEESKRYMSSQLKKAFKTIEIKGETFHYVSAGQESKPMLLLIHGSPGDWGSFSHFFKDPVLLENFEVYTFSRLGFGQNREGTPHGRLADQIQIPLAIIDRFRGDRDLILVGHSYGGPTAAKLAIELQKQGKRVERLVLVSASMDPALEKMMWYQHVAKRAPVRWFVPSMLDVVNREILALKDELILLEKSYPLEIPTTIIHGDIDKLVPIENVTYMKKNFPRHRLMLVQDMRHFVPWAFPSLIKQAIFEYMIESKDLL